VQRLFFDCAVAKQLWSMLPDILKVNIGGSLDDVGTFWQSNKRHGLLRDENGSDTDGYRQYHICFHISGRIRIRIRIMSIMSDKIRLDVDIINIRFKYSDTDTVSDVEYSDSDMDRSEPL